MPDARQRYATSFVEDAGSDLDAARRLALPVLNRHASFHLQQAAEKLAKAVLIARGIPAGTEHRIDQLLDKLPAGDPWRKRLRPLDGLSPFATAFRYPTPAGRLNRGLSVAEIQETAGKIEALLTALAEELAIR